MPTVAELLTENITNAVTNAMTWGGVIYNVKSYGAKGDGVTDDTAAISNAIAAADGNGGIVFFSPGTYVIGSNFTVPSNVTLCFANGAKLSVNSGITVTINGPIEAGLYQIFSGAGTIAGAPKVKYFYPQWWGAKGDGVTDDTAAIQAAINISSINGRGIVYLPSGTYLVGNIKLSSKISVIGENKDTVLIKAKSNLNYQVFTGSIATDVNIKNLTIDGNRINQTSGTGITFWKSRNIRIENVIANNCKTIGIQMSNVTDSIINGCHVNGTDDNCCISYSLDDPEYNTGNNIVTNSIMENGGLDGIIYNNNNGIISNNIIRYNGAKTGYTASGIYVNNKTNITISGNITTNNDGNGIDIANYGKGITCTNNICSNNNSAGIMFDSAIDGIISSNICKNNGISPATNQEDGISLLGNCNNISIIGNECSDDQATKTQPYGIDIQSSCTNILVTGNSLVGNKTDSIRILSVNVQAIGNIPMKIDTTPDIGLASGSSYILIDGTPFAVVEIIDVNLKAIGRFFLKGTDGLVAELYDPYNNFEITDTGTTFAVIYNGTNYVIKNKSAGTRYFRYKIDLISK